MVRCSGIKWLRETFHRVDEQSYQNFNLCKLTDWFCIAFNKTPNWDASHVTKFKSKHSLIFEKLYKWLTNFCRNFCIPCQNE